LLGANVYEPRLKNVGNHFVTATDINMCDYAMGRWRHLTRDKKVISSGTRSAMYKLLHSPSA